MTGGLAVRSRVVAAVRGLGRPRPRDAVAGLVTGLFSIPEGMAYASIGGFNPPPACTPGWCRQLGSVFARTVLMVTTLTSAIALDSQSVLEDAGLDPKDPANIAALALVVGAVMLIFGLLRFGSIMNFVSNAVMTGFATGIAVQIIAGVIHDATGYKPMSGNTIGKFIDAFAHIGLWQPAAVAVALGTVAVWLAFHLIKPLESFAILLALVVVTAIVAIAHIDVETVGDIASISSSFPPLTVPNPPAVPGLLLGGVAVALVALAQAAGISAAVPNPDGSRPTCPWTSWRRALATWSAASSAPCRSVARYHAPEFPHRRGTDALGGHLRRDPASRPGRDCGSAAEIIPMPVIGGLILVIGAELVIGRWPDIKLVLSVAPLSALAMLITFAATTQLPRIPRSSSASSLPWCSIASRLRGPPSCRAVADRRRGLADRSQSPTASRATT